MPVSSTSHVRLLLLVAVTGLFAAAWTGDRPRRPNATGVSARPVAVPAQERLVPISTVAGAADDRPSEPAATQAVALLTVDSLLRGDVPLPEGVAPGDFRVVGTDGTVYALTLTAADLVYLGRPDTLPPRDTYHVEGLDRGWHFIRIGSRPQPSVVRLRRLIEPSVARVSARFTRLADRITDHWSSAWQRMRQRTRSAFGAIQREMETMAQAMQDALRRIDRAGRVAAEPTDSDLR